MDYSNQPVRPKRLLPPGLAITKRTMITAVANETSELKAEYDLRYVWLISIVAAMGGLLFGWDWVVIGGAKPFFQRYFQLSTEAQIGWANSCALLGCLAGALVAGALSDRFGRKRLLIIAALLFGLTSLGNALAGNFAIFIMWRIFGGVAIGLASNLSPMYIAEIAPAQIRGKLVAICSADRSERMALLDAIAGRAIPEEGRVWVSGVPLVHARPGEEARPGPDLRGVVPGRSSPVEVGRAVLPANLVELRRLSCLRA